MPLPVLIVLMVLGVMGLALLYWYAFGRSDVEEKQRNQPRKDRSTLLRQANKQLAANPRDHKALLTLADIYFADQAWEKAMKTYGILVGLCATNQDIEEWFVTTRYALAALQLKRPEEAYKSLMVARTLKADSFDINTNLGYLEHRRGNHERAAQLLNQAHQDSPDHIPTRRYLGRALFKLNRYQDAGRHLKAVIDQDPSDKESLFYLGQIYSELGRSDQALIIFTHLRPDPALGPNSALYAGTIRLAKRESDKAALDFELGLRHENIPEQVELELRYRLAQVYTSQQELGRALTQLTEINKKNPGYKDVASQIARSKELHSNKNLQTYLISSTSEFSALCRRMVNTFFKNATIKITDIAMHKNDYADILAEVETARWEDIILFRFIRGSGQVGELVVRDLNARLKETHSGRGFCITAGTYSESAVHFVEARLIDLLDKDQLLEIFNRLE
ncbi:hypothetical protein AU468_08245 [Alkalispirochaeta sphaeroplastigenens]|uniref:Restriction endonuclease type IV Mrr domain-containing protein n=1 Tax=Alkalispirochaeta sphaeroplastigenens TaxID=1187066 RepID=A0A2S4JP36_9SPIO|nr:tetratricopeptide repeat protein [Alkalispirochaeta sphaeroplastigenens]POR01299.1 hypothetical protein AU468_08245 [Alkalispirochaeta sphaeroplastigenens]